MADRPSGRSVIGIDLGALRHNVRHLRSMAPEAAFFAVVKADGYGHGAVPVARAALDAGSAALCVATLAEARELRDALGEQERIIILFPLSAGEESEVDGLEVVISTPEGRDRLLASGPSCRAPGLNLTLAIGPACPESVASVFPLPTSQISKTPYWVPRPGGTHPVCPQSPRRSRSRATRRNSSRLCPP